MRNSLKLFQQKITPPILLISSTFLFSCDFVERVEHKAEQINRYEKVALQLIKENKELKTKISDLKFKIQSLESQINFLQIKLEKKRKDEASRPKIKVVDPSNDLVKFSIYKWTPSQLVSMGDTALSQKEFGKAAQLFQTFIENFKKHKGINDEILYKAGFSAYESRKYNKWVYSNLERLIREYPSSKYFRKAKLWLGLTMLREGKKTKFFNIVEEFRKKYRNSSEWKILSAHYEDILQKYK